MVSEYLHKNVCVSSTKYLDGWLFLLRSTIGYNTTRQKDRIFYDDILNDEYTHNALFDYWYRQPRGIHVCTLKYILSTPRMS